jgi:two-component system invasion response regulator UvrY
MGTETVVGNRLQESTSIASLILGGTPASLSNRMPKLMKSSTENQRPRHILIVDDHEIVREGVGRLVELNFQDYTPLLANSYGEAIDAVHNNDVAMVITDLSIDGRGGIDLIREISSNPQSPPILVYSYHDEQEYGVRAIKNGASGYIQKNQTMAQLKAAIALTLAGKRYVSPEFAQSLVSFVRRDTKRPAHETLSDREFQVLCRLGKGVSIKDTAAELHLSVKTVSTYRSRILQKLELKSIAEIVRYCLDRKLV